MGAWGTAIADNDDVLDFQGDFENLIDGGATVEDATRQILLSYELTTADDDVDNHDFWLGLALAQYRAGTMTVMCIPKRWKSPSQRQNWSAGLAIPEGKGHLRLETSENSCRAFRTQQYRLPR